MSRRAQPAGDATHGPFRNVVRVETTDTGRLVEWLECGHRGRFTGADVGEAARRRCYPCGADARQAAEAEWELLEAEHAAELDEPMVRSWPTDDPSGTG